jgi:antirestriction protein ArdC
MGKFKRMMEVSFLMERMDYQDTASQLVKQYGLKSKIKFGSGKNFGEYIPETDTITLRKSYPSVKEFLMTILHEIGHALDAKRIGVNKYIKKYTQAGTMAAYDGLDPHDDNKWEEKAEKFAEKELSKWL